MAGQSCIYAIAGDDADLMDKFKWFVRKKYGWVSTDDAPLPLSSPKLPKHLCNYDGSGDALPSSGASRGLESEDEPSPRFAIYLGTCSDDALAFEAKHSHLSIPFFMAGVLANEIGSDSGFFASSGSPSPDSLLEAAAYGFVFRNDADNMVGSPLGDHLSCGGGGRGGSLAALVSLLQCEPATQQTLAGCILQLEDAKSFVAASASAACGRSSSIVPGQQWQVFVFTQDSPPPIMYVRSPSSSSSSSLSSLSLSLSKQSLCVIGCGVLGQEFARELGRRCPATIGRITFLDPSPVTPFDAFNYFSLAHHDNSDDAARMNCAGVDCNVRYKADVAVETFQRQAQQRRVGTMSDTRTVTTTTTTTNALRSSIRDVNLNSERVKEALADADLWVSCVSSVLASRLVAQASIEYLKPVVDAAVYPGELDFSAFAGSVRLFVPRKTESMTCQFETSPAKQPPLCVVSSFPFEIQHAAYWALEKLAKAAIKLKDTPCTNVNGAVVDDVDVETCVARARLCFEKWFHFRVRRLLRAFPLEATDNYGRPYWTYPKLAPAVLDFDAGNEKHLGFVRKFAQFVAKSWTVGRNKGGGGGGVRRKVERRLNDEVNEVVVVVGRTEAAADGVAREIGALTDEQLSQLLGRVRVPDWDEFADERESAKKHISDDPSKVFTGSRLASAMTTGENAVLTKDDPWSLDLLSLTCRLRCDNYGIDVGGEALRGLTQLCWEAASGHAVCDVGASCVAAGMAVSAVNSFLGNLRLLGDEHEHEGKGGETETAEPLQDSSTNLGARPRINTVFATNPVMVQTWTPPCAPVILRVDKDKGKEKGNKDENDEGPGTRAYTVWDRVSLKGDRRQSFGELCSRVQAMFSQTHPPSMVLQDKSLLYMNGMTKAENVRKPAQAVMKPPLNSRVGHVDLFFSFEAEDDQDVAAPIVRYEWDYAGDDEPSSSSSSKVE